MLMGEGVIYSYNLHIYKIYGKRNEFIPYQDIDVERRLIKYLGDKQIKISYFVSSLFFIIASINENLSIRRRGVICNKLFVR